LIAYSARVSAPTRDTMRVCILVEFVPTELVSCLGSGV
jgi:hypothetical protein